MYRVLVVDDEKLERDGIRFLLSMEEGEWEIYEAANGKLALNELRKHPVDLMLTDIKMPHMDGLDLLYGVMKAVRIHRFQYIIRHTIADRLLSKSKISITAENDNFQIRIFLSCFF